MWEGGVYMSETERILENVNATMSMENMPLNDEEKNLVKQCLEGKILFEDAVGNLVNKYVRNRGI